jgi:hypothetical protein
VSWGPPSLQEKERTSGLLEQSRLAPRQDVSASTTTHCALHATSQTTTGVTGALVSWGPPSLQEKERTSGLLEQSQLAPPQDVFCVSTTTQCAPHATPQPTTGLTGALVSWGPPLLQEKERTSGLLEQSRLAPRQDVSASTITHCALHATSQTTTGVTGALVSWGPPSLQEKERTSGLLEQSRLAPRQDVSASTTTHCALHATSQTTTGVTGALVSWGPPSLQEKERTSGLLEQSRLAPRQDVSASTTTHCALHATSQTTTGVTGALVSWGPPSLQEKERTSLLLEQSRLAPPQDVFCVSTTTQCAPHATPQPTTGLTGALVSWGPPSLQEKERTSGLLEQSRLAPRQDVSASTTTHCALHATSQTTTGVTGALVSWGPPLLQEKERTSGLLEQSRLAPRQDVSASTTTHCALHATSQTTTGVTGALVSWGPPSLQEKERTSLLLEQSQLAPPQDVFCVSTTTQCAPHATPQPTTGLTGALVSWGPPSLQEKERTSGLLEQSRLAPRQDVSASTTTHCALHATSQTTTGVTGALVSWGPPLLQEKERTSGLLEQSRLAPRQDVSASTTTHCALHATSQTTTGVTGALVSWGPPSLQEKERTSGLLEQSRLASRQDVSASTTTHCALHATSQTTTGVTGALVSWGPPSLQEKERTSGLLEQSRLASRQDVSASTTTHCALHATSQTTTGVTGALVSWGPPSLQEKERTSGLLEQSRLAPRQDVSASTTTHCALHATSQTTTGVTGALVSWGPPSLQEKERTSGLLEQSQLAPPQDVFCVSTTTQCAPHATPQTTTGVTGALVSWGPPSLQEKERTSLLLAQSQLAPPQDVFCVSTTTQCAPHATPQPTTGLTGALVSWGPPSLQEKERTSLLLEQSQLAPPQDVLSAATTTHCALHATSQTTTGVTGALVSWGPPSLQEKERTSLLLEQSQLAPPQDVFSAATTTQCALHATPQPTTGLTGALVSWGPPSLQEKERTSLLLEQSQLAPPQDVFCVSTTTQCALHATPQPTTGLTGALVSWGPPSLQEEERTSILEPSHLAPREDVSASTTTGYALHATPQLTTGVTGALVSWGPPSLQEVERTSLLELSQLAPRQDVLSAATTTHCALHASHQPTTGLMAALVSGEAA